MLHVIHAGTKILYGDQVCTHSIHKEMRRLSTQSPLDFAFSFNKTCIQSMRMDFARLTVALSLLMTIYELLSGTSSMR